jgi:hypothetical protein
LPGRAFADGNFRLAGRRRPKMSQGETAEVSHSRSQGESWPSP